MNIARRLAFLVLYFPLRILGGAFAIFLALFGLIFCIPIWVLFGSEFLENFWGWICELFEGLNLALGSLETWVRGES